MHITNGKNNFQHNIKNKTYNKGTEKYGINTLGQIDRISSLIVIAILMQVVCKPKLFELHLMKLFHIF